MKKMKRLAAALLALAMFLGAGAALAEVPERGSVLNVREISAKEDALAYAKEIWQLDFLGADISGIPEDAWTVDGGVDEGFWTVTAETGDDSEMQCMFAPDGAVKYVSNLPGSVALAVEEDFSSIEEEDEDAAVAVRDEIDAKFLYPFLKTVNPGLYDVYLETYPEAPLHDVLTHYNGTLVTEDGSFNLSYSETWEFDEYRMKYIMQTSPEYRIVYFDAECSVFEGGNG